MQQDLIESFSGIRGVYGQSINEDLAYNYAFYFAKIFHTQENILLVAGDSRPSTNSLKQAILKAFAEFGIKMVIDLGVVPVQTAEFAIVKFGASGGVYITASHNEPEFNGWKFLKQDGAILYPEQADKLINAVHQFGSAPSVKSQLSTLEIIDKHQEAVRGYIDYVLEKIGQESLEKIKSAEFKVLADPNGGASIESLQELFIRIGVKARIINDEIGKFSRLIEPKEESMKPLALELVGADFDFACGFDCDADRVEIVLSPDSAFTKKMGTPNVSGNYVLALACDAILQGTSGQIVPTNDVTSYLVRDVIKKHNASVFEVQVGEINVVEAMEKNNSLIGGEGSNGGVIIAPVMCRDAIMTMSLALKLMANNNKSLSEILNDYPEYFSDRTKVSCFPEKSIIIRRKIEEYFIQKGWLVQKTGDETGGLKAHPDRNSYVWFRQSKTEPGVFRIYSECDTSKQKATDLLNEGLKAFNKFNF